MALVSLAGLATNIALALIATRSFKFVGLNSTNLFLFFSMFSCF